MTKHVHGVGVDALLHTCNTVDGDNNRRSNAACTVEDVFDAAWFARGATGSGGRQGSARRHTADRGEQQLETQGRREKRKREGRERARYVLGGKEEACKSGRCEGARASPVSAHGYCRWRADATWRPERGVQQGSGGGPVSRGGEVDRAACVTSEAPGGIGNHHNRVDAYVAEGDVGRQRNQLEDRGRGGHRG